MILQLKDQQKIKVQSQNNKLREVYDKAVTMQHNLQRALEVSEKKKENKRSYGAKAIESHAKSIAKALGPKKQKFSNQTLMWSFVGKKNTESHKSTTASTEKRLQYQKIESCYFCGKQFARNEKKKSYDHVRRCENKQAKVQQMKKKAISNFHFNKMEVGNILSFLPMKQFQSTIMIWKS